MGLERHLLFAAAALALTSGAVAQKKPASSSASPASKTLQSCDAHKFETVVDTVVGGEPHQSKVKLCGNEGQTEAEWIHTLEDAIAKLDANTEMAPAVRDQIVTAIKAEIARLNSPPTATTTTIDLARRDVQPSISSRPLARDYAALPPLPSAAPPPPRVLGTQAVSASGAVVSALPSIPAPKLSFDCYSPGDIGGDAPCTDFVRETMLTIRADEDVPRGVALHFVRNGSDRGEVDLAELRRGRSMRIALPESVCHGFTDGKLDLRLVHEVGGASEDLGTDGPYVLRC